MLKKIGMLVVTSAVIAGCQSAPKELATDFDGEYALEVLCPPYSGTSRNVDVSLGKISGTVVVNGPCSFSGYIDKVGVASINVSCPEVTGEMWGKVVDRENGIFEGDGIIAGMGNCEPSWKVSRIKHQ